MKGIICFLLFIASFISSVCAQDLSATEMGIWVFYKNKIFKKHQDSVYRSDFMSLDKSYFLAEGVYRRKLKATPEVYEYASRSISIYTQYKADTTSIDKQHLKRLWGNEMRSLSKMEGRLLIKLVERHLGMSFYNLIAYVDDKGTADYYERLAKYGGIGSLKLGYDSSEYRVLEKVFQSEGATEKITSQIKR